MATYITYYDIKDKLQLTKNCQKNMDKVLKKYDQITYDNWVILSEDKNVTDKCVCSKEIKNNYHVQNLNTGEVFIIGSVCIEKFSEYQEIKHQLKNVKKLIKYRKNPTTRCKSCYKKVSEAILDKQILQKDKYHIKCLKTAFKKCYKCKRGYRGYNCLCHICEYDGCNNIIYNYEPWKTICISCWKNKKGLK